MPKKANSTSKATKTAAPAAASASDLWLNVFLSVFGISLFFSGIQSLQFDQSSAAVLGVVAALSGGVVLGLALGRLRSRRSK